MATSSHCNAWFARTAGAHVTAARLTLLSACSSELHHSFGSHHVLWQLVAAHWKSVVAQRWWWAASVLPAAATASSCSGWWRCRFQPLHEDALCCQSQGCCGGERRCTCHCIQPGGGGSGGGSGWRQRRWTGGGCSRHALPWQPFRLHTRPYKSFRSRAGRRTAAPADGCNQMDAIKSTRGLRLCACM